MSQRAPARWLSLVLSLGALGFACQFEAEEVCGPELEFNSKLSTCQCPSGTVLRGSRCQACGAHEVAVIDMCECESGYVRDGSGACAPPVEGLADSCEPTAATACEGKKYNYCAPSTAGGGYCTQATCTVSADCPVGYTCATWASPTYCVRQPTGLGNTCSAAADCMGKEAAFCDSVISNTCLVQNCDVAKNDCIDGYECCDFSAYGAPRLCVPPGVCPK